MSVTTEPTSTTEVVLSGVTGQWRLGAVLGRGASGTTYVAHDRVSGREVVAKVLRIVDVEEWKAHDLFVREATVLGQLVHPSIPRYVDHVASEDGTLALIMERVPGVTLASATGVGAVDEPRLRAWLRAGLEVLSYLHARWPPLVHRDVTPKNIMVDGDRVSLIDFGTVKASLRDSTMMTAAGTFGFMPPEQMRGDALPASDIYGLGVSLLCAASGMRPEELPTNHATGGIDISQLEGLSPDLAHVLQRMVEPGLEKRYPSADEALRELDEPRFARRVRVDRDVELAIPIGRAQGWVLDDQRHRPAPPRIHLLVVAAVLALMAAIAGLANSEIGAGIFGFSAFVCGLGHFFQRANDP